MEEAQLLSTPTWAIASTCFIFIAVSLLVERFIHFIGHVFIKHKQIALNEALEKIKEELMMVGFISLALTVGQTEFAKICVPERWSTVMLQCSNAAPKTNASSEIRHDAVASHRRGLEERAVLVDCSKGKAPFITLGTLHELHILIFLLVLTHVIYSAITIALGIWKVHHWKAWEEKAKDASSNGQVRLTRDATFVRKHVTGIWSTNNVLAYVAAFIQQFTKSVSEVDYLTLRNGFIKIHMPSNTSFDFYKYILRALEDDFKYVVGISPALWGYTIVLLLLNVNGWVLRVFAAYAPLLLVLLVGTKLQCIITRMAVKLIEKRAVIEGLPDVQPNDGLFWFSRPRFILSCIHFILFQNAFELAFYVWSFLTFPKDACLNEHRYLVILRILVGAFGQLTCGYVTLPIYALVSQMGSSVKKAIFEEHVQVALMRWHKKVKGKKASVMGGPNNRDVHECHSVHQDDVEGGAAEPRGTQDDVEGGAAEPRGTQDDGERGAAEPRGTQEGQHE